MERCETHARTRQDVLRDASEKFNGVDARASGKCSCENSQAMFYANARHCSYLASKADFIFNARPRSYV